MDISAMGDERMAKYDPLCKHLHQQVNGSVILTFCDIESILGDLLPPSAGKYPEWWANETNPHTTHTQCKAWLEAGFKAFPNLAAREVRFAKGS
jgi:hypothetical protein